MRMGGTSGFEETKRPHGLIKASLFSISKVTASAASVGCCVLMVIEVEEGVSPNRPSGGWGPI
jgi:hypothetical protein